MKSRSVHNNKGCSIDWDILQVGDCEIGKLVDYRNHIQDLVSVSTIDYTTNPFAVYSQLIGRFGDDLII